MEMEWDLEVEPVARAHVAVTDFRCGLLPFPINTWPLPVHIEVLLCFLILASCFSLRFPMATVLFSLEVCFPCLRMLGLELHSLHNRQLHIKDSSAELLLLL